jgi:hypothetical protein
MFDIEAKKYDDKVHLAVIGAYENDGTYSCYCKNVETGYIMRKDGYASLDKAIEIAKIMAYNLNPCFFTPIKSKLANSYFSNCWKS